MGSLKIGVLGGGQLGKMLLLHAANYPQEIGILDPDPQAPCAAICENFTQGDFKDYQTVMDFGKDMDVLGIEIEHVNVQALKELRAMGKVVIPDPEVLEMIQDKGKQKEFYLQNNIPTAPLTDDFPKVQKLKTGGYDGRGVKVLPTPQEETLAGDSIFETLADIDKELSLLVAVFQDRTYFKYPIVEQVFDPELNQLDFLFSPARITEEQYQTINEIGDSVINALGSPGLFAIELFLNKDGSIWVNEIAPRLHNSGHGTIEGHWHSQFEMQHRILSGLSGEFIDESVTYGTMNLIGSPNSSGIAHLHGLEVLGEFPQAKLHWYGKKISKPGRKMGHITILGNDFEDIKSDIDYLKSTIKVEGNG